MTKRHDIKLRTMTWQKASWLLAGDQVCLAIMAQTWSLSVLGWVPGIITMVLAGVLFWITSMTMHKFIMVRPQIATHSIETTANTSPSVTHKSRTSAILHTTHVAKASSHTSLPASCFC